MKEVTPLETAKNVLRTQLTIAGYNPKYAKQRAIRGVESINRSTFAYKEDAEHWQQVLVELRKLKVKDICCTSGKSQDGLIL